MLKTTGENRMKFKYKGIELEMDAAEFQVFMKTMGETVKAAIDSGQLTESDDEISDGLELAATMAIGSMVEAEREKVRLQRELQEFLMYKHLRKEQEEKLRDEQLRLIEEYNEFRDNGPVFNMPTHSFRNPSYMPTYSMKIKITPPEHGNINNVRSNQPGI